VPEYGYTLTNHDPGRPWLVVGRQHRTVTLEADANFFEWAHDTWPAPRWSVELDPWEMSPTQPRPPNAA
jgi:hypothetical protein